MLVGALIIIGISYALWSTTKEQTSVNKISSGCLKLEVTEGTNINMENAYQTPDSEGLKQDGYNFTINNNCNHEEYVEVNLDINKNNTLNAKNIRATLLYKGNKIIEPNNLNNLLDRETTNKDYNTGKHLTTVKIDANSNKQLNLKIWLDENTSFNELEQNNTFESKIEIDSIKRENILASDYIRIISEDNEQLAYDETKDNNLRYISKTPNNYVDIGDGTYDTDLYYGYKQEFSPNSLVEYTSLEACEQGTEGSYNNCKLIHKKGEPILWRIIGVMNNVDDGTGKKETRIKLIRDEDIGNIAWDAKCNGIIDEVNETCSSYTGENNWTTSTLKTTLNEAFLNSTITTDRTYTSPYLEIGTTDNWNIKYRKLDFSKSGIKNKELVANAKYYLNQLDLSSATRGYTKLLTKEFYNAERTRNVKANFPEDWIGVVGLLYPSDYGYATNGGTNKTRDECLNITLYGNNTTHTVNNYSVSGCHKTNWISDNFYIQTMASRSDANSIINILYWGQITGGSLVFNPSGRVKPVIYLKSNTIIKRGTGTEKDPFILTI